MAARRPKQVQPSATVKRSRSVKNAPRDKEGKFKKA